jgi:hypothetical protein
MQTLREYLKDWAFKLTGIKDYDVDQAESAIRELFKGAVPEEMPSKIKNGQNESYLYPAQNGAWNDCRTRTLENLRKI